MTELFLCPLDLLADGADRDVELSGGGRQRAQAGDGFHGAQAVEVDAVQHGHFSFSKLVWPKSQLKYAKKTADFNGQPDLWSKADEDFIIAEGFLRSWRGTRPVA
ncbi:hypothetical protein [Mesorhizobium sp. STM 4661]|uniref:hypothetical protein n=1 Tax=Mesorhizobium sp. STM 4661 TaxID=1297570 RepID=UPI001FCC11A2|nr:hypothetical protein [Mesorhizobium sp. STM 4661]